MTVAIDLANNSEPMARQIERALRHAIVTMQIKPGEMLSEQDLATRLAVSRQPVREAFIKLGESGLIRILPQRGTLVVRISVAAVEEARFIREAIECAVARDAAALFTPELGTALTESLARQRQAARSNNLAAFFRLDEEFHRLLAEAAGKPSAWRVIEDFKAQMDRVRYLSMADATPMRTLIAQHKAIADAVTARKPSTAENAMRSHLREILRSLPVLAERHPDLFEPDAIIPKPLAVASL